MAKLSVAQAKKRLAGANATWRFDDIERAIGSWERSIHQLGTPVYVFELSDGEVRVASRDRSTIKSVRVFARPARLPAAAVLDDHGESYVIERREGDERVHEAYAVDTGALVRRTTSRDGVLTKVEEPGADGALVETLEPLLVAIHGRRRAEVEQRLATLPPTVRDEHGATLLHHLAEHFRDAVLAKELIARGAEVDARDQPLQRTPLYIAIEEAPRVSDFVEVLVEAGADLDARCWPPFDNTVLHLACDSKSGVMTAKEEALAIWLIEHGANPDIEDANQSTARSIATEKGHTRILEAIARTKPAMKSAAKKPAARKPAAKRPAAKKPAAKKPVAKRRAT